MSTQLLDPLHSLKTTLRRVAVVQGLAMCLTLLLCLILGIGTVDWLVHIDNGAARLSLGLAICLTLVICTWRWVITPAFGALTDLQIARRLESAYPELSERVTNSVEFVQNRATGSQTLQRTAIHRAADDVARLEPDELVDRRPARHAVVVAVLACSLTAVLFGVRTAEAEIGLRRLVFPFRDVPWPRTTNLRLIDETGAVLQGPLTTVKGEYRELLAENTLGVLPPDSAIEYRLGVQGKSRFVALQPIAPEIETTGEIGRAVIGVADGPLYLRAKGGDHRTPWYKLNVVRPPRAKSMEIKVIHPAYTGRDAAVLPEGTTTIEALLGSRVEFRIAASQPLASAAVMVRDRAIETTIAPDRRTVTASVDLDREGTASWWVELTSADGIDDPRPVRYELRVLGDEPPSVFIENPLTDTTATAEAVVPIQAVATDDLRIEELQLEMLRSGSEQGQIDQPTDPVFTEGRRSAEVATELRLSELDLEPGDRIELAAIARDQLVDDESHTVRSEPRQLLIVTAEIKAASLAEAQSRLFDELQRVVDAERNAREGIAELRIQERETGALRRADLDLLKRTEIDQHRIGSTLFDENDGLEKRIGRLKREFQANGITSPEAASQLQNALAELQHIREQLRVPVESRLTETRKRAEETLRQSDSGQAPPKSDLAAPLAEVENLQSEIVHSIESVLDGAEAWRQRVDVQGELSGIGSRQAELNRDAVALAERSLQSATEADRRQQAADAGRLARQQTRLAEEFDGLLQRLRDAAQEGGADPREDGRLEAATALVDQKTPTAKMREAATQLADGRPEAAASLQAEVSEIIQELSDLLNRSSVQPFENTLEDLADAERTISELVAAQKAIEQKLEANPNTEALRGEQSELAGRTERQARQLQRLQAEDAASAVSLAAEAMRDGEQALDARDLDRARSASARAVEQLRAAADETEKLRETFERVARRQSLIEAIGQLRQLLADQNTLIDATLAQQAAFTQQGRRTRSQSREVLRLGERQGELAARVEALAEQLADQQVVSLTLEAAADFMRRAERLLAERETGEGTTVAQSAAVAQLTDLVEALMPQDPDAQEDPAANPNAPPPGETEQQAGELVPLLVKLRLLRSLQRSVRDETTQLLNASAQDQDRVRKLAARQVQITQIAADLLSQLQQPGDSNGQ